MKKPSIEIKKTHHCLRRYIEAEVDKVIGGDLTGIQGVVIDFIYYKSVEKGEDIFQRDITEIKVTAVMKQAQRNSMVITAMSALSVFALLVNFTVVVIFMKSIDMMGSVFL